MSKKLSDNQKCFEEECGQELLKQQKMLNELEENKLKFKRSITDSNENAYLKSLNDLLDSITTLLGNDYFLFNFKNNQVNWFNF